MVQQYGKDWYTWYNKDQLLTRSPYRTGYSFASDKEWNGTLTRKQLDITAGATTTLDWDKHNYFNVALGVDTAITIVNPRENSDFVVLFTKDNTATQRNILWSSAITWPEDEAVLTLTAANETKLIVITYFGGVYRAISFGVGVTVGDSRGFFNTVADAAAAEIPVILERVYTKTYNTTTDKGGAWYKRAASEPVHSLKFQDALTNWWEIDEPQIYAEMAGAVGDGVTNDGPAIQAAIAAASAQGGGLILLMANKVYAYGDRLTINASNVIVRGVGGGNRQAGGDSTFDNVATRLKWIGAEDGTMAYVGAIEGGTDKCVNSGFEDICFDANSLAGAGIEYRSIFRPRLARVRFHEFSVTALLFDIVEVLTQDRNTNEGWLQAVSIYNVARPGNGITIQRTTALSGGNVSNNVFSDVTCTTHTGHGLVLGCSDNLTFTDCRFAIASGGTGKSIRILASNRDATDVPRAIVFDHVSYDSMEITTGTYMPRAINILNYDVDNATPLPSVTAGFYPGRFQGNDGRDVATAIAASGGVLDLGLSGTDVVDASGSGETVSSFGDRDRRLYVVRFTQAMTLVNGANLVLPGGADISASAGDWCIAYSNSAALWRVVSYQKANGQPLMNRVSTSTDASYTAAIADTGGSVAMNNGSANDFVLPANADLALPIGFKCRVYQQGAGQTTILPGSGVTANATPGLKISARYGYADVEKRGTNVWFVTGTLSA